MEYIDPAAKPFGVQATPELTTPQFNEYRLALTKSDFNLLDADNDQALSRNELTEALSEPDGFLKDQTKRDGVKGLLASYDDALVLQSLARSPYPTACTGPASEGIRSWFTKDAAAAQLSKADIGIIDSDTDHVLTMTELTAASKSKELSPMSRLAADTLAHELDAAASDPYLKVKVDGVKDWFHAQEVSDKALDRLAHPDDQPGLVPGLKLKMAGAGIMVTEYDAQGRATKLDAGPERFELKYDDQGRITEVDRSWSYDGGSSTKTKVTYDDTRQRQTIETTGEDGKLKASSISEFNDGERLQETTTRIDPSTGKPEQTETTYFDANGDAEKQTTQYPDGSEDVTRIIHHDGNKTVLTTHANGDIDKACFGPDGNALYRVSMQFNKQGGLSGTLAPKGDFMDARLNGKEVDSEGRTVAEHEAKYEKNPYLVSEMVSRDQAGNVTTIKPHWEIKDGQPKLNSIDCIDAEGNRQTLEPGKSEGSPIWNRVREYSNPRFFMHGEVPRPLSEETLSVNGYA